MDYLQYGLPQQVTLIPIICNRPEKLNPRLQQSMNGSIHWADRRDLVFSRIINAQYNMALAQEEKEREQDIGGTWTPAALREGLICFRGVLLPASHTLTEKILLARSDD